MNDLIDNNRIIVYFRKRMRVKDNQKEEAIFESTIKLLNEEGFSHITMAKIAKESALSSSTIYVYFKNKEDMLKKVYLKVKEKLSDAIVSNIEDKTDIKKAMEQLIENTWSFARQHPQYFLFIEQFFNSPYSQIACSDEDDDLFGPLAQLFDDGKKRGLLKPVSTELLMIFCYQPVIQVAKNNIKRTCPMPDIDVEQIKLLCWDAIKA